MATTSKAERVIGLWRDGVGDPGNPKWIVSRDTWVDGEPDTTTTVQVFEEGDRVSATLAATELAHGEGLALILTREDGTHARLLEPGGND